jgi:tetratricopeptide (TPR) repeat protein
MAYGSGDIPAASSIAGQALELHRRLGDARGAAFNLNVLCVAAIEDGDLEQAQQFAEESLALFREAGDEREAVAATRTLAFTYHSRGDLDRARTLHESNLAQAQAFGFKETEAGTLGSLAMLAFEQGRIEDALALGKQNLLASRDLGSLHAIAQSLCRSAGTFAVLPEKAATAARLLSCFEALREQIGVSEAWVARMNEQTLSAIRARLDESAFAEAWEQGRALTIDEAVALALESID